jgi:CPA2 family monovalent cation:H+ antiporter-2
MVPFIWALAIRRIQKEAYAHLWLNKRINRGPLIAIEVARIVVAVVLVAFLFQQYFSFSIAFMIGVGAMALAILIFRRKLQAFYERLEARFLTNLNERETIRGPKPEIAPWDAHLAEFDVSAESPVAGKQLIELQLRELYGVNIALIERGTHTITVPDRFERVYPGDKLLLIGTDEQLARVKPLFDRAPDADSDSEVHQEDIGLQNFTITRDSRLCNQSLDHSGIRQSGKALVVGVERNGERILNPNSSLVLLEGDIIWIVGVSDQIREFVS